MARFSSSPRTVRLVEVRDVRSKEPIVLGRVRRGKNGIVDTAFGRHATYPCVCSCISALSTHVASAFRPSTRAAGGGCRVAPSFGPSNGRKRRVRVRDDNARVTRAVWEPRISRTRHLARLCLRNTCILPLRPSVGWRSSSSSGRVGTSTCIDTSQPIPSRSLRKISISLSPLLLLVPSFLVVRIEISILPVPFHRDLHERSRYLSFGGVGTRAQGQRYRYLPRHRLCSCAVSLVRSTNERWTGSVDVHDTVPFRTSIRRRCTSQATKACARGEEAQE